jgi:hypothetical protein
MQAEAQTELRDAYAQLDAANQRVIMATRALTQLKRDDAQRQDIARLEELHKYMRTHGAYFGQLRLMYMGHAMSAYDIELYRYPLHVTGGDTPFTQLCDAAVGESEDVSGFVIDGVPSPSNAVEERLYPHVVRHLQPHLPILFETYDPAYDDVGYRIRAQKQAPIGFTKEYGAFVSVYYLTR